jgi:hypothetical protein
MKQLLIKLKTENKSIGAQIQLFTTKGVLDPREVFEAGDENLRFPTLDV